MLDPPISDVNRGRPYAFRSHDPFAEEEEIGRHHEEGMRLSLKDQS